MINLLNNAAEALKNIPEPRIKVLLSMIESLPEALTDDQITTPCLCLQICDNGKGISKEHLPQVFDPFFTTQDVGKGTGLGLAMVYGTLQTHHGAVTIDSSLGEGCCVSLYLPLYRESDAPCTVEPAPDSRLILLLEPDSKESTLIRQQLQGMGHEVLVLHHPESALACLDDNNISALMIDAVLLGDEPLIRQLRDKQPTLPWLCLGDAVDIAGGEELPCLHRPVTVSQLRQFLLPLLHD